MANRILRDWTDSEKINSLSVHAERFFTRLIMKVDDYGCFYADERLIKANLYPLLLDSIREADLVRWIAECKTADLIVLYETKGKRYLQIIDFNQRLRQKRLKYPLPNDSDLTATCPPEVETKPKLETETKLNANALTFEKVFMEVMGSERWIGDTALHYKKTIPEIIDFLENFLNESIKLKDDWSKGVSEVKKHFISSLKIILEKEKNSAKKESEVKTTAENLD